MTGEPLPHSESRWGWGGAGPWPRPRLSRRPREEQKGGWSHLKSPGWGMAGVGGTGMLCPLDIWEGQRQGRISSTPAPPGLGAFSYSPPAPPPPSRASAWPGLSKRLASSALPDSCWVWLNGCWFEHLRSGDGAGLDATEVVHVYRRCTRAYILLYGTYMCLTCG